MSFIFTNKGKFGEKKIYRRDNFGYHCIKKLQFHEISLHIENEVKVDSTERRIQAFFSDFEFNYQDIASFLLMLLPKGKLTLCMDRTECDFGKFQSNILMVTARCEGIGIPLFWELLDNKSGNSNVQNRINLMEKCVNLLGKRISFVIGDREFIGISGLNA